MSDTTRRALLALLADGRMHAGPELAGRLGVSRSAVWKLVGELRRSGVDIASVDRRGYQLAEPCELLDATAIGAAAAQLGRPLASEVEVQFATDSTNEYLYASPAPPAGSPRILLAEIQRAGRGRRGRSWLAPFGSGLTFSIAWSYPDVPAELSALSLALGVQVADALRAEGAGETMLKWPNDIVWRHRKLGGLLIQLRLEAGGAASVVVGLGLNVSLRDEARSSLAVPGATPVADLREAIGARPPGRNLLAGRLIAVMCDGLERFGRDGFAPFAARWQELDSLAGAEVSVTQSTGSIEGRALGADRDGALRVETGGRVERYLAGDVSLRAARERTA
jgi:BirA family transcriptional regulator, biotin operon repressor / biotin---[acetyl-CoA-carboxylase] ligase